MISARPDPAGHRADRLRLPDVWNAGPGSSALMAVSVPPLDLFLEDPDPIVEAGRVLAAVRQAQAHRAEPRQLLVERL